MTTEIEKNINEKITSNITDEEIKEFVIDYTCRKCGDEFEKPGSCERCIDYEMMRAHKDYIYRLAIERRNYLKINSRMINLV